MPGILLVTILDATLKCNKMGFLGMLAAVLSLAGYFYVQWDVTGHVWRSLVDEGPRYREATTMTLVGIVSCQVANAFACRSERDSLFRVGIFTNVTLLWAIVERSRSWPP